MNQFASISSFEAQSKPISFRFLAENPIFSKELRNIAARFQMHYALIHRLGSASIKLKDATYVSILRNLETSNWTLGDLINQVAL
ncbi:MAG: hypothetical protein ACRCT6_13005, partial [Notoacmeibacter sp.]